MNLMTHWELLTPADKCFYIELKDGDWMMLHRGCLNNLLPQTRLDLAKRLEREAKTQNSFGFYTTRDVDMLDSIKEHLSCEVCKRRDYVSVPAR